MSTTDIDTTTTTAKEAEITVAATDETSPPDTEISLEETKEGEGEGTPEAKDEEGGTVEAEKFQDEPSTSAEDDDDNGKKKKSINWATVPTTISSWFQKGWAMLLGLFKPVQEWFAKIPWSNLFNMKTRMGQATAAILFVVLVSVGIVVGAFASVGNSIAEGFEIITSMDISLEASMVKHPAYAGDLNPYGKVTLRFDDNGSSEPSDQMFLVAFQMEGLEPFCQGCTWRIVQGTSCQDANELGEDWWNPNALDHNPYGASDHNALYDTQEGASTSKMKFYSGFGPADTVDHAFLVFAQDQSPLACGVLRSHGQPSNHQLRYSAELMRESDGVVLPGYAEMDFNLDDTFALNLFLGGLPPDCVNCVLDIQDGESCDASHLGNVYTNPNVYEQHHVWTTTNGAVYTPNDAGMIEQTIYLHDGFGFDDHEGKLVILRSMDQSVYACGVLETKRGHLEKPSMDVASAQAVQIHG